MAVKEASAQDILLQQLSQRVSDLAAEQKAKESAIRDLNDRMKLADAALAKKLRETEAAFEVRRKELEAAIQPLEALKPEVPRLKAQIEQLNKEKVDAVGEIRAAKGGAIKEMDQRLDVGSKRLAKIEVAIQQCKEKVAGL